MTNAIDPDHYKFPGGAEVRHISAHLTSFGGQAVQYVARSTRLDGRNKGDQVENLEKALVLIVWEIERLGGNVKPDIDPVTVEQVAKAMYERPDEEGEGSVWPPDHGDDAEWFLNNARVAIRTINGTP